MAWRIHLSNQAIPAMHILSGKPSAIAVRTRRDKVQVFALETGMLLSEISLSRIPDSPRSSEIWQNFLAKLVGADKHFYLPYLRLGKLELFSTDDGKLRIYYQQDEQLFIETDGEEEELRIIGGERFLAMDLDGALGVFVGLDERLRLHIYQQNIRVGAFDVGLKAEEDMRAAVCISRGADVIFASDGRRLVAVDTGGNRKKKIETHYQIGRLACSPAGGMVLTSDTEAGVLRAYKGENLVLTHQRFAIDLLESANELQLLGDLPPLASSVTAIAAHAKGILAFAMGGVICVTDVSEMDEVPRPKPLL
jgi:hypothetical protein